MARRVRHPRPVVVGRARAGRQRGAALVEAVFVLPLLVLLTFGVIEWGLAYSDLSTTTHASRAGSRLGATAYAPSSSKATTAAAIGDAIEADLDSLTNAVPIEAWIYRANGGPPSTCNQSSNCWKMTWVASTGQFGTPTGGWATVDACGDDVDDIGVMVKVRHDMVSGLFGTSRTLIERTTTRIEPLPTDQCA